MSNKFKCHKCNCENYQIITRFKYTLNKRYVCRIFYICEKCGSKLHFERNINMDLELAKLSKQAGFKYLYKRRLFKDKIFFMIVKIEDIIKLERFPKIIITEDKKYYRLYKNKPIWKNLTDYSHYLSEFVNSLNIQFTNV